MTAEIIVNGDVVTILVVIVLILLAIYLVKRI